MKKVRALFRVLEADGWVRNHYGRIDKILTNGDRIRLGLLKASILIQFKSVDNDGRKVWTVIRKVAVSKIKVDEKTGKISGLDLTAVKADKEGDEK